MPLTDGHNSKLGKSDFLLYFLIFHSSESVSAKLNFGVCRLLALTWKVSGKKQKSAQLFALN